MIGITLSILVNSFIQFLFNKLIYIIFGHMCFLLLLRLSVKCIFFLFWGSITLTKCILGLLTLTKWWWHPILVSLFLLFFKLIVFSFSSFVTFIIFVVAIFSLYSLIQEAQKFFVEMNNSDDTGNVLLLKLCIVFKCLGSFLILYFYDIYLWWNEFSILKRTDCWLSMAVLQLVKIRRYFGLDGTVVDDITV